MWFASLAALAESPGPDVEARAVVQELLNHFVVAHHDGFDEK